MIGKILLLLLCICPQVKAEVGKTIKLCENNVATVYISTRGTALEFPMEPEKVVLGTKSSFSIEYIKNDLTISPATLSSRSNLFVYLQGRRFVLDLVNSSAGVGLYFIKDCDSDRVKPEAKSGRRK
jgi:hypothetical protein